MSSRLVNAAAVLALASSASGCDRGMADLPAPLAFADCLHQAGLPTSGVDEARARRAVMGDPRALACAAHDLDSRELRDALHGAFTRTQAYDAVRGFVAQQPSTRGADALAEDAGSLYGGMAEEDWGTRPELVLLAWAAWTHEHGVPETYDAWVGDHRAQLSRRDPDRSAIGYLTASGRRQPDTEQHRTWVAVQDLRLTASRACRSVRAAA